MEVKVNRFAVRPYKLGRNTLSYMVVLVTPAGEMPTGLGFPVTPEGKRMARAAAAAKAAA